MKAKGNGIIEAAMRHHNIVIIIAVVLMIIGVIALQVMPRNEFPKFTIRQGVVVGVYPGATSAEVEEQLTKVVENYIFGYQEVKKAKTYSYSREGIMYIFVELNDDVTNADQFWSKLNLGLNDLKMNLPSGVLALIVNSDFGDTAALLITLSSDTKSYKEMEEQLKKLEAECRKIPATSKIKHYGLQKEKIFVNIKPELLNEYNVKTISLLSSYMPNGMVNYAGELKDGKYNMPIHFPPSFESEKDLADQIVYSDPTGNVVRLKNIATIERRYDDPDSYIKQNGMKTILLSLEMQPGNNIVQFGKDVDEALTKFQNTCPADIQVAKISELPKYVDDSVSNFMHEFLIAIVAVILVTMLLLPLRVASVAGITVPIAVLITLAGMYFFGIELHTVSLAALIIVLGMIVDNSIVVIDNYVEKLDHRISPWHAAIQSAKELFTPIVTATLAIISAYFPLMIFLPGTAGEFVETLPLVVGLALIVSILVAVLIVPYLNFVFIKKGLKKSKSDKGRKTLLDWLQKWFDLTLEKAFHHRNWTMGGAAIVLIGSFALFTNIDQELFPEVERNQFAVEVYLPTGASLESTAEVIDSLEKSLLNDKRVATVTSFIGTSSPRFHTMYAPNMPAPNYGQLMVNTTSDKATREIVNEYNKKYADNFVNAHVKWKILAMQLNKAPIEIRISSDSINDIRNVQAQVENIIQNTKYIAWVRNDWDQKQQNIKIEIDKDKANRLGYSKGFIATSLMVGMDGIPLTTIWENDYPVEVRLTQETEKQKSAKTIEDQTITSLASFRALPLRSFAQLKPEWTEGTIAHRNGTRTLTISADNESGKMASAIFSEIEPQISQIELPEGTSIEYGGDYEGQLETFVPMSIALALSVVLIFFILLFQFKKSKLALLILSTMLLGIPGAAIGLTLIGYPFSLTAFIGVTSLCGMVVRNGIILIDYAHELKEKDRKMTVKEAALAAGKRRMRPIFLTAAAASVGVIPMILSGSPLWGPLGTVICFGLLISMVLTLYVLPILYSWVYSDKPQKSGFWSVPATKVIAIMLIALPFASKNADAQIALSLDSCKNLALENNRKIKEAGYNLAISEEQKKEAFTNYFPKVSAMAVGLKSSDYLLKAKTPEMNFPVYDGNPANLANPTQFAYIPSMSIGLMDYMNTAAITVAQPIFTGGRIFNGNRLAKTAIEINKEQESLTEIEVLAKTEEFYWTIVSLNEKNKTLELYKQLLDTLERDVNVAYKAGLVQRTDLLKVQLKMNEIEVNRMKLNDGISLSKQALCQHLGIKCDSTLLLSTSANEPESPSKFYIQSNIAATNRSEYKILSNVVKVEELQKQIAIGENLPQVSVGLAGYYLDMMDNSNTNTIAFATISIPISDWWGGTHKIRQSNLRVANAQNKLDETVELLTLQINQAKNEMTQCYFQIEIAKKSVKQAEENLKITSDNYKAGIVSMSDLLEAQSAWQGTQDGLTEALCNYQIKKAQYLKTINNYK